MPDALSSDQANFVKSALAWLHEPTTSMGQALDFYEATYKDPGCTNWVLAELGRGDRFFLAVHLLKRVDVIHPWLYARCREVEASPDGHLDLWSREHYKSSLITFFGTIQEILRDRELTVCIFSFNKAVARKFLKQIKYEFETNASLKTLYPDVLYADPQKESPGWSEDGGLIVRRLTNPREPTLFSSGVVDGQPTGSHFKLMIFDDLVTLDSVTSPEMVTKTLEAWSLSNNLAARGEDGLSRFQMVGTRYHLSDPYHTMMEMGAVKPRIYPATDTGLREGKPVFLSEKTWAEKVKMMTTTVLAAQMLQNPAAGSAAIFQKEWLRFMDIRPATLNVYILCDPASSRKKGSDRTAMPVIGVDSAGNYWLLDGYHHRMGLSERWRNLKALRKVWMAMPGVQTVKVGYERYGSTSDLEHFELEMKRDGDHFEIHELAWPKEGPGSKTDRVQRLEPYFRGGRFFIPAVAPSRDGATTETKNQLAMRAQGQAWRILTPTHRKDEEGRLYSLNKNLLDEYLTFPYSQHDDLVDAISRIFDIEAIAPVIIDQSVLEPETFADGQ